MELPLVLNYIRFCTCPIALFFTASPLLLSSTILLATALYSLLIPLLKGSYSSVISHKCISHIPSTLLLVLASYNDRGGYRSVFLVAGALQYLNIWLQMYSEIFTKELRTQVLAKTTPQAADEAIWVLSDVNYM